MLKRAYDGLVAYSSHPAAPWLLFFLTFVESSVSPLPPIPLLIPMCIARPDRAWFYAGVCSLGAVLGGYLGYAIGALLYDSVGQWLIHFYGLGGKMDAFRESYAAYGALIIIGKGVTPIPYKLITIASGFAGYNIWLFILCSIVARGIRFFLVAILLNRYGDWIRVRIERHLGLWVALGAIVLVLGFVVAVKLI